ncbi:hypothetical protein [Phenylobacterium parvum]|uniref:Uncharacterized protein n=1 Tax=Phenylobacterium parvum TaxID=2201350 RepID=A0A2Z3I3H0_9CAUL|nr:hypothetical protein [Phenylobacterium parvum]AWM78034.1 hypothetical protein HYN04_09885 [Phenylobacterium parvum]
MINRQRLRLGWVVLVGLAYLACLLWYGGSGPALTPSEGRAFLERVRTSPSASGHPEVLTTLETLIARDDGREFYMLNLEQLAAGPEARKADMAYARVVLPALLRNGSLPVYIGRVQGQLIGDHPRAFNRAALVRYRSLRDFLVIFTDPAMTSGVGNKFASLTYTEARATTPVFSLLAIQLAAAGVFGALGLAGWGLLRPR